MRLMHRYVKHFLILLALFMQTVSAQSVANPKVTYFHNDITGTAVAATDEKGEVIWREQRRAYGEIKVDPLKPKSLDEFSVGYTGHQADKESGLTYAKARYYNKAIGRFYAPDPIPFRENDLVSINRYAYAANNPYKFFDPMGTDKWLITQKYDNTISDAEATVVAGAIGIVLPPVAALQEYNEDGLNAGMALDVIPYGKLLHKAKEIVTTATNPASEVSKSFKAVKKASPCSFKADTLVATPQGLKPIAELNEGDYVMARDELTGQVSAKQITHKFVEWHDDDVRELIVSNGLIETVIITSDEHPFYVFSKGFTAASELKTNNQLVSLDYQILQVVSNKRLETSMPMYNFEVADYHTYAVSEQNVWVHNDCSPVANVAEFFTREYGSAIKDISKKTSKRYQSQSIYKINNDSGVLRKGDHYYLDNLHKDHIEVFDKNGNFRFVMNLDGTKNDDKTLKAAGRTIKDILK